MKRLVRTGLTLALFLLVPALIKAQGQQITAGPFPTSGLLYVCPVPSGGTPCPSPSAIFSNSGLTQALSNPISLPAQATVTFYAAGGQYTLEMPASGVQQVVGGGSGILSVSSLPPTCAPGTVFQLNVSPFTVYICPSAGVFGDITGTGEVLATSFGVNANGKFDTAASLTNGSGNVVLSAAAPNATAADINSPCFGTQYTGGTGYFNTSIILPLGTIDTVTDTKHFHCTTNSSNTLTGTVGWGGADNATAFTNAANAAFNNGTSTPCRTLLLPSGLMWTSKGFGNASTCLANIPTAGDSVEEARGEGMRNSIIGILPGFSMSHATSCTGTNGACFFGIQGMALQDFSVFGFGNNTPSPAAPAGTVLFYNGIDSYFQNIDCEQFGSSDPNLTGLSFGQYTYNVNMNSCGATAATVFGTQASSTIDFFAAGLNSAITIPVSTVWFDRNSAVSSGGCGNSVVIPAGTVYLEETFSFNACTTGNTATINVAATGIVHLDKYVTTQVAANQLDIQTVTGSVVHIRNSTLSNPGGTGFVISRFSSGGTVFDEGGNTFGGASQNLAPTCTFTSGGGTSPSCTLQAGSRNESGTIIATTGTGTPGSTGTITLTFAGTYVGANSVAPSCSVTPNDSGTAWGNGALAKVSTQSTTAPIFAWSNSAANVLTALAVSSPFRLDYVCPAR